MENTTRNLILCAALPSSGSTLVSWCFLQRPDTDGVLDAPSDVLRNLPGTSSPLLWCKTTISAFRMTEMIEHYTDQGYDVQPVLVIRDVRAAANSIISKPHIANGTTAEEPPLRTRLRRFLHDWQALRDRAVVIRYESLVQQPDQALRDACDQLGVGWSGDMLAWPKPATQIADAVHANPSFCQNRGFSFIATVDPAMADVDVSSVPQDDLDWIDAEFAEFNRVNGYPDHLPRAATRNSPKGRAEPSFANTRRYRTQRRVQSLLSTRLGSICQIVRYPLRGFTPSAKPNKAQQNYFGYATLFAD